MNACPCPKHPMGCYGHPYKCGCAEAEKTKDQRILELEARVATLSKERDEARAQRDDLGRAWDQADARALAAEARVATLSKAIEHAYGILWRDHSRHSAEKSIAARKELLAVLSKEGQKRGLEYALALYGPTSDGEILALDDTPIGECPECHKYIGKCPYCHRPRPAIAPDAVSITVEQIAESVWQTTLDAICDMPAASVEANDELALRAAAKVYNASLDGDHYGATKRIIEAYLASLAAREASR